MRPVGVSSASRRGGPPCLPLPSCVDRAALGNHAVKVGASSKLGQHRQTSV